LRPRGIAVLPIVFSLFCTSAAAETRNWSINPGISLSGTYSDNVAPNLTGFDETDFVTQINPELRAELDGRRVQAHLNYRMQNILYADNDEDATYHQYLARAGAEVLREHFFIDASSTLTQRTENTNGVRVRNNYTITGNRIDQLTASIRPSWYQPIGSYAEALLDYEHGIVNFDDVELPGTISDSRLDAVSLTVNNRSEAQRLSWKFNARGQQIDYEDNALDEVKLRHAGLLLGYRVMPRLSPLALIGYEDNDYGNRPVSTDPTDPYWALGFRWQPNPRSELEALAGHRFFGNTYRLNWRQRGRYLTSELAYTEKIQDETTSALGGVSLIDYPGAYPTVALGVTGNVFLSKTIRATAKFKKSKTSITITPFFEKREFGDSSLDERVGGIRGKWEWAFAPRTVFTASLHWDDTDARIGEEDQTFIWSALQLQRQLGQQATASIQYAYTEADSDDSQLAYTENALTAQLTYWFGTPVEKETEPSSRRSRRQQREPLF
jgi:hypothetical protein